MIATLSPFVLLAMTAVIMCAGLRRAGAMGPLTVWLRGRDQ